MDVLTIAAEVTEKTIWYPTITGILVAVSAVVLFFGSAYLLLGTNVGARLGFLITFSGLTGFMVVLTALWVTTSFPLNVMRGTLPSWEVIEVSESFDNVPDSVRDIREAGEEADAIGSADVKAVVDETLVRHEAAAGEELPEGINDEAIFDGVTDYQVTTTFLKGGSSPNPLALEFTHTPLFAVAEFCENLDVQVLPGLPPPDPVCDPNGASGVVVLERNLGAMRQPPQIAFVISAILFGLSLLALHWYERDRQAAKKAEEAATTGGDS